MKKILFIVDQPNWAWDIKSKNILKHRSSEYSFEILYERNIKGVSNNFLNVNFKKYDAVLVYGLYQHKYLYQAQKINKNIRTLQGISSCFELEKDENKKILIKLSKDVNAIFVHNKIALNQLKEEIKNLFYCPNGVDTEMFKSIKNISESDNIVVGFAGNSKSKGEKGFYDFIVPACNNLKNTKIRFLDLSIKKTIPYKIMPYFYNNIDCYVCSSLSEGTPNPCLESASCARPLITTRVGNMPDLVKDKKNSLFVERSIEDVREKIIFYRDNKNILISHGKKIREDIVLNWSWEKQSKNYKEMFSSVFK